MGEEQGKQNSLTTTRLQEFKSLASPHAPRTTVEHMCPGGRVLHMMRDGDLTIIATAGRLELCALGS